MFFNVFASEKCSEKCSGTKSTFRLLFVSVGVWGGEGDEKGDLCRRGSAPKHHVTHIKAQERSIITPLTDKA